MSSLNKLSSWIDIGNHSKKISEKSLNEMFNDDKDRFSKFSIQRKNLLLDFSKNHIDNKTMKLFSEINWITFDLTLIIGFFTFLL